MSPSLPVSHSIPAAGAIAALVARQYDVGPVARCALVRTWANDVFELETAGGAHVFKVYRHGWRSEADVRWEIALLAHLAAHGADVARAVPRRDGHPLMTVAAPEGPRPAVLFRAAPGAPPRRPFSAEMFHAYGLAAARLHAAGQGFADPGGSRRTLDLDYLVGEPMRALRTRLASRPADLAFAEALSRELVAGITALAPRLEWGPCHGDLSLDNLHVDGDGGVTLYDLDSAGLGWLAWDISGAMHGAVPAAFAAGYREVRPLDEAALAALPLFAAADQLRFLGDECGRLALWLGRAQASDRQVDERLAWLRRWAAEHGR